MAPSATAVASAFFDGWDGVAQVALTCVLAYAGLVLVLRISGKRTLAHLNAFDWVVTVALGSTLATTILAEEVALAEGMTALTLLVALQYGVAFAASRSQALARVVKNEPVLLVHRGELLRAALRRERIGEHEVLQALRSSGIASLRDVHAVVLESNGTLAVISEAEADPVVLGDVGRPGGDGGA